MLICEGVACISFSLQIRHQHIRVRVIKKLNVSQSYKEQESTIMVILKFRNQQVINRTVASGRHLF